MNVLIVYAHPEARSLNGSLKDFTVKRLAAAGHNVQVSDLYAMNWKAALDANDSLDRDPEARFDPSLDSKRAYAAGRQSSDIQAEQEKLRWADTLILQFPLWWFSMPAILRVGSSVCMPMASPTVSASIPTLAGVTATAKASWPASAPC